MRIRILIALARMVPGKLSTSEIEQVINGSRWASQRAMSALIADGLVISERIGRRAYYSLTPDGVKTLRTLRDDIDRALGA